MKIKFETIPITRSTGRNGWIKTSGIDIYDWNDEIHISPLTSRGVIGNCTIVIPKEEIDKFTELLKQFK